MLNLNEVKVGTRIEINNTPYEVIYREHSKIGRAGAVLRTKLKNLKTGAVISQTFQGSESLKETEVTLAKAQFLYREGDDYYFMEESNYEQFSLNRKSLGDTIFFLIEGTTLNVMIYNGKPINVDLPIKMDFRVKESPPALRGNTADGGSKQVKLETGFTLSVPLFIKEGDVIRINTRDGKYVERVSS